MSIYIYIYINTFSYIYISNNMRPTYMNKRTCSQRQIAPPFPFLGTTNRLIETWGSYPWPETHSPRQEEMITIMIKSHKKTTTLNSINSKDFPRSHVKIHVNSRKFSMFLGKNQVKSCKNPEHPQFFPGKYGKIPDLLGISWASPRFTGPPAAPRSPGRSPSGRSPTWRRARGTRPRSKARIPCRWDGD